MEGFVLINEANGRHERTNDDLRVVLKEVDLQTQQVTTESGGVGLVTPA